MATRGETTKKLANQKLPHASTGIKPETINFRLSYSIPAAHGTLFVFVRVWCFLSLVISLLIPARPRALSFDERDRHKMIIIKWTR
jgi:hypothetical protein